MRNQTRNTNSEQVERLPIYESVLLTIQRWLHVGGFFASVLLGCVTLGLGFGLSIILGVSEEFIFVSMRLIYWLVIIFAFTIMHTAYRVWLDYRPYICALFKEESKHAEVLDVFSHPVYQCLCALCVMGIVAFYYFTFEPQISSSFVYWYVFSALMLAGIAASFGVYFSIALLILVRYIFKQKVLILFSFSPARTPGILAISYISVFWNIAYIIGLLVILAGILMGPWGTSIRTVRLFLATGTAAITIWSAVHFCYIQFLLHRILQKEKLRSLVYMESRLKDESKSDIKAEEMESWLKLIEQVEKSPTSVFTSWGVLRSLILSSLPWGLLVINRWDYAKNLVDFALRQLGLR